MSKKVCWITGASSGIGEALAVHLAKDGYSVAGSARSEDKLQHLASADYGAGKFVSYPLEVTDLEAVKKTAGAIASAEGGIDLAVLCAGTYIPDSAARFNSAKFQAQFNLNVMGVAHALEVLIPIMKHRPGAQIAVVASVAGYRGLPYASGYGGTKAALINIVESLRPQCERMGIKLQLVCPGFVKTPLTDKNPFPMPFLIDADKAAEIIAKGLNSNRFEIVFPWQMKILMKLLRLLPYPLYFMLTKQTLKDDA